MLKENDIYDYVFIRAKARIKKTTFIYNSLKNWFMGSLTECIFFKVFKNINKWQFQIEHSISFNSCRYSVKYVTISSRFYDKSCLVDDILSVVEKLPRIYSDPDALIFNACKSMAFLSSVYHISHLIKLWLFCCTDRQ